MTPEKGAEMWAFVKSIFKHKRFILKFQWNFKNEHIGCVNHCSRWSIVGYLVIQVIYASFWSLQAVATFFFEYINLNEFPEQDRIPFATIIYEYIFGIFFSISLSAYTYNKYHNNKIIPKHHG